MALAYRRQSIAVPNFMGESGKHELVFYDWGDVNAYRTVICVHGLARNAHDFAILAEALVATGRRVISINMAGRGESAWLDDPAGYTYPAYVADCLAVMDNFHLRGVEWVGTSMGGLIGMMLAATYPGRIRKLIMNDIGIHLSRDSFARIVTYLRLMPKRFTSRTEADAHLRTIYAPFNITDPALWADFVDHSLLSHPDGGVQLACDPAILEPIRIATKDYTEMMDVNLSSIWEQISIPSLILHGADSDILSAETVRAMRTSNPKADSITFPGVGHAPALITADQIEPVVQWLTIPATTMVASGL